MNLVHLEMTRITFITLFNWLEDILEMTLFCTQFSLLILFFLDNALLILLAIQIIAVFFSAFAAMFSLELAL